MTILSSYLCVLCVSLGQAFNTNFLNFSADQRYTEGNYSPTTEADGAAPLLPSTSQRSPPSHPQQGQGRSIYHQAFFSASARKGPGEERKDAEITASESRKFYPTSSTPTEPFGVSPQPSLSASRETTGDPLRTRNIRNSIGIDSKSTDRQLQLLTEQMTLALQVLKAQSESIQTLTNKVDKLESRE